MHWLLTHRTGVLLFSAALGLGVARIITRKKRNLSLAWTKLVKTAHYDQDLSLDEFVVKQGARSWAKLLENIHPKGTSPGCVVASPSRNSPDYFYQWTRDSSLVMRAVVQKWLEGQTDLLPLITDFVDASKDMQHRETLSGNYRTGGLGEVKYHVDRRPYTGSWGRPQRDGPALRAILLMTFAKHLLKTDDGHGRHYVRQQLYDGLQDTETVIKADLDYVAREWNSAGFDLWEEVDGRHFYTLLCSLSSLRQGAAFAKQMGDVEAGKRYAACATEIEVALARFWDADRGYIRVTLDQGWDNNKSSALDTCVVLAALHAGESGAPWTIDSPKIIATQRAIIESMRPVYRLNEQYPNGACLVGRYCEDVYDGAGVSRGNPWYLCVLANAELLYRLAHTLQHSEASSEVQEELRKSGFVSDRSSTIRDLRQQADEFVEIVRRFKEPDGSMAEQIGRDDGQPRGAHDLTWSYAAFLSMQAARNLQPAFGST